MPSGGRERRPLLYLGKNDAWTVGDAFEGTVIFGATGSGKTSGSGQALAKSFLKAGFGGSPANDLLPIAFLNRALASALSALLDFAF
jgi:hypothetical protein